MPFCNVFKKTLPWVQSPLIANAPMSGAALSELAIAVSRAGGLGQIGFLDDMHELSNELEVARDKLQDLMATHPDPQVLPIGVGVIVFGSPMEAWMKLFKTHEPAVVWLSFAGTDELRQWTEAIRQASPKSQVWIQLGSVKAALEVAQACHPDALVLQGSDAGGHGHQDGASIVSLIPEVTDTFLQHGIIDIPLVAAGGIVDGRGTAAALALGASAVVMGTRFLSAPETRIPQIYRDSIFKASDGGQATARSRVFDEIWGPNFWPATYDGRCLRNKVYDLYASGMGIKKIRSWLASEMNGSGSESLDVHDMGSLWAGTGVGMVNTPQRAGDIVQTVRGDALKRIGSLLQGE
jgi:nitronate monooxygenase